jgi:hypothetical protein
MLDLEKKSKKELLDIIDQLRSKLGEMQGVEAKHEALEQGLDGFGFSVVQDSSDRFQIVELGFDFSSKAAKITNVREVVSQGYEYAMYEAKKILIEKVMNKNNLNHLKKEKNNG